jgi:hypothetical protein
MSERLCFNCRKRFRTKRDIKSVDGNRACLKCYKRVKYGAATVDGEGTPATAETALVHEHASTSRVQPSRTGGENGDVVPVNFLNVDENDRDNDIDPPGLREPAAILAPSPSDRLLAIGVGARRYRRRRHDVETHERPRFWPFHEEVSTGWRICDKRPRQVIHVRVKEFVQGPSSGRCMIRIPSWSLRFDEDEEADAWVEQCALLHRAYCYVLCSMQGCNDTVTRRLYSKWEGWPYFRDAVNLLQEDIRAIRALCGHPFWCSRHDKESEVHGDFMERNPGVKFYLDKVLRYECLSLTGGNRQYARESAYLPQPDRPGFDLAALISQWVHICDGQEMVVQGPEGAPGTCAEESLSPNLTLSYLKTKAVQSSTGEFSVHKLLVVRD